MINAYFAYGSNMDPERVRQRGLAFTRALAAALPGHALVFDKRAARVTGAGHANIRYCPGATVHGVLYVLEHPDMIQRMDPYEQAPINYGREVFHLATATATALAESGESGEPASSAPREWMPAWVYVGNPGVLQEGLRPEPEYMAHLLLGAPYLPADYLAALRSIECLPPTP